MKTTYTISAADARALVRLYDILVECLDRDHMTIQELERAEEGNQAIFRIFQEMEKGE